MTTIIRPPVPELAMAKGESPEELALHFIHYHNQPSIGWSYRSGTGALLSAHQGLHDLDVLASASLIEKIAQARTCNEQLIRLAAPFSFGRRTQVFQLPHRRFSFGRDRGAAYRIPFFFVEHGIIKLYYVQPRKMTAPSLDELAMIATIHKKFLLDTEFYGERCDLEYVDIGPDTVGGARSPRRYTLADLHLWSDARLAERLTNLAKGLELAEASGMLTDAQRRPARPSAQMPLFD